MKTSTIVIILFLSFVSYAQNNKVTPAVTGSVISVDELKSDVRKLWEEHVTITNNVIKSIITDQVGIDELVTQMNQNQKDMGDAIASYYGDEAGQKFIKLLHTNISLAADLMIATRRGNDGAKAEKRLKENAEEIAAFLNSVNPNWNLEEMKTMICSQQKYVADKSMAVKNDNPTAMLEAYEKANVQMTAFADKMSNGIIRQFPERFQEFTHSYGMK